MGEAMVKQQLQFNTLPVLVARPNIVVEKLLPPPTFSFKHNSLPTTAQRATLRQREVQLP